MSIGNKKNVPAVFASKKKDVLGAMRLLSRFQPACVQAERTIRRMARVDMGALDEARIEALLREKTPIEGILEQFAFPEMVANDT